MEVRIAPMMKKRIEAILGHEIDPLAGNTIKNFESIDENKIRDLKRVAETGDQILAERYFKFLASPEVHPYIFGFLNEVILSGGNREDWIKNNIK